MAIDGAIKLNVQILRDGKPAIGPGRAMVMKAVDHAGSISKAARELGMSYRRAWLLVEGLNQDWAEPVIATKIGGGARLTDFGRDLLSRYEHMEAAMMAIGRDRHAIDLTHLLRRETAG